MEQDLPEKSTEELLANLNHPDARQRQAALTLLANAGVRDEKFISELRLIARADPDRRVRSAAKKALRSLGIRFSARPPYGTHSSGLHLDADFWMGVIIWITVNAILWLLSIASQNSRIGSIQLFVNIGLLMFFAFTRRNIALGMLVAFGFALLIPICLGIFFLAYCFIGGAFPR